jgi:hypothetical protein
MSEHHPNQFDWMVKANRWVQFGHTLFTLAVDPIGVT